MKNIFNKIALLSIISIVFLSGCSTRSYDSGNSYRSSNERVSFQKELNDIANSINRTNQNMQMQNTNNNLDSLNQNMEMLNNNMMRNDFNQRSGTWFK